MELTLHRLIKALGSAADMDKFQVLEPNLKDCQRFLSQGTACVFYDGALLVGSNWSLSQPQKLIDIANLYERIHKAQLEHIFSLPDGDVERLVTDLNTVQQRAHHNSSDGLPRSHQQFLKTFRKATELDASDIHIYCEKGRPGKAYAKFKVAGEFHPEPLFFVNYEDGFEMLRATFDTFGEKEDSNDFDDRSIQETTFMYPKTGHSLEYTGIKSRRLRFTKSIAQNGQLVYTVIRLLGTKALRLSQLQLTQSDEDMICRNVRRETGLILTSGPTGSGKTTTMTAAAMEFPQNKSLQTLEDPIEIVLPDGFENIVQNSLSSDGYSHQVKIFLRQDIEAMLVGEIRDRDTLKLTIEGARNGHLCISTVHANSPIEIIDRLVTLGANPKDLASPSVLRLLMGQRLEQLLCPHCKKTASKYLSIDEVQHVFSQIETLDGLFVRSYEGCRHCSGIGIKGRRLAIEMIELDDQDRDFICREDILGWKKHLQQQRHEFLLDKALMLAQQGLICIEGVVNRARQKVTGRTIDA